jgi:hypothetical protein
MHPSIFAAVALAVLVSVHETLPAQTAPTPEPDAPSINAGDADNRPKRQRSGSLGLVSKDRPKGAQTEITCIGETTFDNIAHLATFSARPGTNVLVKDPQFTLYCQELKVFLKDDGTRGIKFIEATGKVIIIQEGVNDKGETVKSTGNGEKALIDPQTEALTLLGWPRIQQGINTHIAIEEGTIMILHRQGRLETTGGVKTTIIDSENQGVLP